jgi:lipid II:glycine glycyltransferase (peptidoglycan interpeptide bridge formation enzyme)
MKDINATVMVDISPPEEEILKNLQKDARWGIKKAQKDGLIVEKSTDWESFYPIYLETLKEAGVKPETLEHLKEHAKALFLCKKDKNVIAGSSLDIVEGIPYLTRNASLKEYRSFQPNNLLYWQCILWSKQNGYKKLNLGGWQINPRGNAAGVNKFKERWGKVEFYQKNYPFHVAIGRKLVRNFGFFRWLNDKLKGR